MLLAMQSRNDNNDGNRDEDGDDDDYDDSLGNDDIVRKEKRLS